MYRSSSRGGRRLPRYAGTRKRPDKQWLGLVNQTITISAGASVTSLLAFEAPTITAGTPLTSDPPEDKTILRVLMDFTVSSEVVFTMWMGLLLVDRTWTPTGTTNIGPDLDKRLLWMMKFENFITATQGVIWSDRTRRVYTAATTLEVTNCHDPDHSFLDISPKVKIEDGKHLVMCTWSSSAAPVATLDSCRILMQRAGR